MAVLKPGHLRIHVYRKGRSGCIVQGTPAGLLKHLRSTRPDTELCWSEHGSEETSVRTTVEEFRLRFAAHSVYAIQDHAPASKARALPKRIPSSSNPIGKTQRFRILNRDGFRCQLCGRSPGEHSIVLEVDHKISRADGGTNHDDNLHSTCFDCNRGKGRHSL